MKKTIITMVLSLIAVCASGQAVSTRGLDRTAPVESMKKGFLYFDLNGICLGDKVTQEQVIEIFGQPEKVETYTGPSPSEGGNGSTGYFIYYKDFKVLISSLNGFYYFLSFNPSTRICTKDIPGGIGIGDSVEKLKALDVYYWKDAEIYDEYSQKTGGNWYLFCRTEIKADTGGAFVLVKDGKIIGFEGIAEDPDEESD